MKWYFLLVDSYSYLWIVILHSHLKRYRSKYLSYFGKDFIQTRQKSNSFIWRLSNNQSDLELIRNLALVDLAESGNLTCSLISFYCIILAHSIQRESILNKFVKKSLGHTRWTRPIIKNNGTKVGNSDEIVTQLTG